MYQPSAVLTAPAPHPCTREVTVAGSGGLAVERIAQWLASFTSTDGQCRFRPCHWDPAGGIPDTAPKRDLVLSWYAAPNETEAAVEPILRGMSSGSTWVGLGPLSIPAAHSLAERAQAAGVTYVHAPLRQDPALLREGARTWVLAYQHPGEGARSHTYAVLSALSIHIAWMGALH